MQHNNQLIHKSIELFTLKRSRILKDFTLKDSRFYAETLPHSIYTYINIYKKTVISVVKFVDKSIPRILATLVFASLTTMFISGCTVSRADKEQDAALHLIKIPHTDFEQFEASELHPAEYFTCGELGNPCRHYLLITPKGDRQHA
jgi:hypothetical protein